jgi:hypothetical protein
MFYWLYNQSHSLEQRCDIFFFIYLHNSEKKLHDSHIKDLKTDWNLDWTIVPNLSIK